MNEAEETMAEPKTREELLADCDNTISRVELEAKMSGKPDFVLEEYYCAGKGTYCKDGDLCVQLAAHAKLPTRFGEFEIYGFYDAKQDKEHTALVKGKVAGAQALPLRVHSQCHTGDVFGSLRCDCRDQLEWAMEYVEKAGVGAVIYLKQEGRGIGLLNKIKAYRLQELGLDTVEANRYLGYPDDARDYTVAAKIIGLLGIRSVALMTNNPDKVQQLESLGITVSGRIPIVIPPNPHSAAYLDTKRDKMGHLY
jgi:GTP cyclohydrolase II